MSDDPRSALEADLGHALPPGLAALPAEQLASLSGAFRERRAALLAELERAIDDAIEHLPALLRNQARRVLAK